MIKIKHSGNFKNTEKFLSRSFNSHSYRLLDEYGRRGVALLAAATPIDSGLTASSWGYEIKKIGSGYSLTWTNSHIVDGVPIVILLQYGHGTGSGGYVQGRDFINPVIRPIFDKIAETLWEEVTKK